MSGLSGDWERLRALRDSEQPQEPGSDDQAAGTEPALFESGPVPAEVSRRPRPGRTRGGRRPAPEAASAVPTTVRFDPQESAEVDRFILDLRDETGRTRLDKAEVVRELLRLAREHEPTRRALLKRIR
jgi:hypothetical protein